MTKLTLRRIAFASLVLPLALAGCGSSEEDAGALSGEPIAAIPAPEGTSWLEAARISDAGGFIQGNPDAPLKLVEYASHTCSHCARFSMDSSGNIEHYVESGVVSYELRNVLMNPLDIVITMLSRCGTPEAYHPLANQAWANLNDIINNAQQNDVAMQAAAQSAPEQRFQALGEASGLIDFFAARGISRDQAMQCLGDTARIQSVVETSQTHAEEDQVTGTPTFFLNGSRIDGTAWSVVEPALQQAGAR